METEGALFKQKKRNSGTWKKGTNLKILEEKRTGVGSQLDGEVWKEKPKKVAEVLPWEDGDNMNLFRKQKSRFGGEGGELRGPTATWWVWDFLLQPNEESWQSAVKQIYNWGGEVRAKDKDLGALANPTVKSWQRGGNKQTKTTVNKLGEQKESLGPRSQQRAKFQSKSG